MTDNSKLVEDILGDWGWADEEVEVNEVQDNSTYLLGLDPGGTTGVALVKIDPDAKKGSLPELLYLDQVPDGMYGFKDYFGNYYIDEHTIVISEKWKERNVKGADREPQYIEGGMHMLWGAENVEWQYPEMKSLIPDEFLKEQGVWWEGHRHAMDALIHILAWLRNQAGGGAGQGDGDGEDGNTLADAANALVEALGGQSEQKMGDQGQGGKGDGTPQNEFGEHSLTEWGQDRGEQGEESAAGYAKTDDEHANHKKRTLNDGFIGFESPEVEAGGAAVTLLDD